MNKLFISLFILFFSANSFTQSIKLSNYPNPFNPKTRIIFNIPEDSHIKLIIFNSLGEKVETLIDEYYLSGNYSIDFDGTNLASGIYFCTLMFKQNVTTKKMLLLK